jgi:hypothetical protein
MFGAERTGTNTIPLYLSPIAKPPE